MKPNVAPTSNHANQVFRDLEIAIEELHSKSLTMAIVKEGRILYASRSKGIVAFIKAIEELKKALENSSLADKVAGRAIALLTTYVGIGAVYAEVISEGAVEVFQKFKIPYCYARKVAAIMNREGTGPCPFERAVRSIEDPELAFLKLKKMIEAEEFNS